MHKTTNSQRQAETVATVAMVAMAAMVVVAGMRNEIVTGIGSNGEARRREKTREKRTEINSETWKMDEN